MSLPTSVAEIIKSIAIQISVLVFNLLSRKVKK